MSITGSLLHNAGCFKDAENRDMPGYAKQIPDMTITKCIGICVSLVSINILRKCTGIGLD